MLARSSTPGSSASSATRAWTSTRRSTSGTTRGRCSTSGCWRRAARPRRAARTTSSAPSSCSSARCSRRSRRPTAIAPVLLIDEIDRADEEFEAFLLEILSDFQVTVPEIGTIRAAQPPRVVLTSNRTREVHDALKRRCLYHWIDYPTREKSRDRRARVPEAPERLAREVVDVRAGAARGGLTKLPGVAETLDWAAALMALGARDLDARLVDETLGVVLKYEEDIRQVRGDTARRYLAEAAARVDRLCGGWSPPRRGRRTFITPQSRPHACRTKMGRSSFVRDGRTPAAPAYDRSGDPTMTLPPPRSHRAGSGRSGRHAAHDARRGGRSVHHPGRRDRRRHARRAARVGLAGRTAARGPPVRLAGARDGGPVRLRRRDLRRPWAHRRWLAQPERGHGGRPDAGPRRQRGSVARSRQATMRSRSIRESWDLLHKEYVGASDLDDQSLAHAAINGMTEAVGDEGHTTFLTPDAVKDAEASLSGEYVGIGTIVDESDDGLRIEGVFPDSPADKAGLGVGDEITRGGWRHDRDDTVGDVAASIRGAAGTTVKLTIDPAGPPGPRDVTLTRANVTIPVVDWAMVPDYIADVRLYQFSNGAIEKLMDALKEAKAAGAKSLVLDLRSNPGGFVDQAIGVRQPVPQSGDVFITEDADGTHARRRCGPTAMARDLPPSFLVDRSTASAAEIVALGDPGAACGRGRGEQTFGTGTVLNRFGLTTARPRDWGPALADAGRVAALARGPRRPTSRSPSARASSQSRHEIWTDLRGGCSLGRAAPGGGGGPGVDAMRSRRCVGRRPRRGSFGREARRGDPKASSR